MADSDGRQAADPASRDANVPVMQTPVRAGRPEPVFNLPAVVLAAMAICAGLHLVRTQFLTPDQDFDLLLRTAFIGLRYTGGHDLDFWAFASPVTYSLLHGDVAHLVVNLVWLAAFGSPLVGRLGTARLVLFWIVTSVAAAALFMVFHPSSAVPMVGASGVISGMMAAAARFGFRIDRAHRPARFSGPPLGISDVFRTRGTLVFLAVWLIVNLVTGLLGAVPGFEGQIAWEAHLGGFLAGFFCLPAFLGSSRRKA